MCPREAKQVGVLIQPYKIMICFVSNGIFDNFSTHQGFGKSLWAQLGGIHHRHGDIRTRIPTGLFNLKLMTYVVLVGGSGERAAVGSSKGRHSRRCVACGRSLRSQILFISAHPMLRLRRVADTEGFSWYCG